MLPDDSIEIWKPVPGMDRYEVSNHGRVKTNKRRPRILKQFVDHRGYQIVILKNGLRNKSFAVHRLVMISFVGPRPDGMECRHLDSDHTNNKLSNLAYGTRQENELDRSMHRMNNPGVSKVGKLTKDDVLSIRQRATDGEAYEIIAKDYSINPSCISEAARGVTFAYLPGAVARRRNCAKGV